MILPNTAKIRMKNHIDILLLAAAAKMIYGDSMNNVVKLDILVDFPTLWIST